MTFMPNSFSEENPNENLREELDQLNTKLDAVMSELAKITTLVEALRQDVYALSKE